MIAALEQLVAIERFRSRPEGSEWVEVAVDLADHVTGTNPRNAATMFGQH